MQENGYESSVEPTLHDAHNNFSNTRGVIRTKKSAPEQKSAPGGKKRSRGQKKVFPGAPERSTFAELVIFLAGQKSL
jgi:hypothetical protein